MGVGQDLVGCTWDQWARVKIFSLGPTCRYCGKLRLRYSPKGAMCRYCGKPRLRYSPKGWRAGIVGSSGWDILPRDNVLVLWESWIEMFSQGAMWIELGLRYSSKGQCGLSPGWDVLPKGYLCWCGFLLVGMWNNVVVLCSCDYTMCCVVCVIRYFQTKQACWYHEVHSTFVHYLILIVFKGI